jgi:hypothetical protein
MAGDPKTAGIYLGMTLIMSALPILLVGGLGYWLWRRIRRTGFSLSAFDFPPGAETQNQTG